MLGGNNHELILGYFDFGLTIIKRKGDEYIEKAPNSTIWLHSYVDYILYCWHYVYAYI